MTVKIIIIGPPRSGKTTLINILIEKLKTKYEISGFLTPEVRKKGRRIGFDVKSIGANIRIPLARKDGYDVKYQLGSYNVFINKFNKFLREYIKTDIRINNSDEKKEQIVLIDEIGKMELFSKEFENFLKEIFNSNTSIIATIGKTLNHPIKLNLKASPDVKFFELSRQNQKLILSAILKLLKKN